MTNLPMKEYTADEIVQLYYRRWEIEKKYHTLKNKLKFESVTGKASVYVFQDFLSQILSITWYKMCGVRRITW